MVIPAGEHRKEPTIFSLEASGEITVVLENDAQATVLCIVKGNSKYPLEIRQKGSVAEGSKLHWINVTIGSIAEQSLISTCTGEGAVSTIDWIFCASDQESQRLVQKIFMPQVMEEGRSR